MPIAPARVCATCGHIDCLTHSRKPWTHQAAAPLRIRGRKLQRLRNDLFRRQPMCAICKVSPSTIRDHVKSLKEGGLDVESNVQGLCQRCSDTKTAAESQRGKAAQR